jgi:hypothetical protein
MKELLNYQTPKIGFFDKLFFNAAGADTRILNQCSYSDHVKYFCLGGIVLATGIMAGIAGGYAFYTIFSPKVMDYPEQIYPIWVFWSIVFGIVWGYMIFNLDRYIVASTGKGDGTENITRKEFINALPRMAMGTILAVTISQPLEIRIFQSEINAELKKKQIEYRDQLREGANAKYKEQIGKLEAEEKRLNNELSNRQAEFNKLQKEYIEEGRIGYFGDKAKEIKKEMDKKQIEIDALSVSIIDIKKQITVKVAERENEYKDKEKDAKQLDGLLERIKIAHEIGGNVSLFIFLLFLAIELTPIFFKLMIIKSPYDYLEENVQKIIRAREAIEYRPEYYKVGADGNAVDYSIFYVPNQMIEEQRNIITKQQQLSDKIVEKWHDKKSKEIEANPEDFYKTEE